MVKKSIPSYHQPLSQSNYHPMVIGLIPKKIPSRYIQGKPTKYETCIRKRTQVFFFAETFLLPNPYNANKLPDLYLVILSQPVLEIHMISCYPAAPQGRKRKGANCAALVCGGSREKAGRDPAAFLQFSDCCHFLSFCLPLPVFACPLWYLILSCLARYLPCTSLYFLSVVCPCLLGLPVAAACLFFLSDFVTSGLGSARLMVRNAG